MYGKRDGITLTIHNFAGKKYPGIFFVILKKQQIIMKEPINGSFPNRKVILYIAMSLDGYIARKDDGPEWLFDVERTGEDYGYGEFIKSVDTVIIGRRTYEKVMTMGVPFPHKDKQCYIITRTVRPAEGNLTFYDKDLKQLVVSLKKKSGGSIFVDGGAKIVNALLRDGLIDDFIISIIPVILGGGIALFNGSGSEELLDLVSIKHFDSGLVQLHYRKRNEKTANS